MDNNNDDDDQGSQQRTSTHTSQQEAHKHTHNYQFSTKIPPVQLLISAWFAADVGVTRDKSRAKFDDDDDDFKGRELGQSEARRRCEGGEEKKKKKKKALHRFRRLKLTDSHLPHSVGRMFEAQLRTALNMNIDTHTHRHTIITRWFKWYSLVKGGQSEADSRSDILWIYWRWLLLPLLLLFFSRTIYARVRLHSRTSLASIEPWTHRLYKKKTKALFNMAT